MKILLDTHCWLWMQASPRRFSAEALRTIENPENTLYLSAASSWEIAIKYALGRLPLPTPPGDYVPDRIASSGVVPLRIEHSHALRVATLPAHHRDPFDRLLVAQAQLEGLEILSADPKLDPYEVTIRRAN